MGGNIDVNVHAERKLVEGEFLWFGLEGVFGFDDESATTQIPQACIERLALFLEVDDQVSLEYGHLVVCEKEIPKHLHGRQLGGASLRTGAGINVLALGKVPWVTC